MELVLSSVTTAAVNLIVFSFLPVLWWFFRHRQAGGFLKWIGFFRPQLKSSWRILLLFAVLYAFFYNFDFTQLVDPQTLAYIESSASVSANAFAGLGAAAVLFGLMHNILYMAAAAAYSL